MTNENPTTEEELLTTKIRSKENGEHSIKLAEREINRLCGELDVDDGTNQLAQAIYRRSLDEKFIENRTIGMVAAASVYAACRVENQVRGSKEVSELAVDPQVKRTGKDAIMNRVFSELSASLGITVGPIDPKKLIPNLVDKLNLSEECEYKADDLLNNVDQGAMTGKAPTSLAAGAVYAASLLTNCPTTQKEVAEAANVSVTTIRNTYQEIITEVGFRV